MPRFIQGYYTPKHPEKYIGDINHIRYMSSYEYALDEFFDNNINVIHWSSEEIVIPYVKPTDGKIHKYYPDYFIEYRNSKGNIVQELIECKPKTQTKPPRSNHKYYLYEKVTHEVNKAKWEAAIQWCNMRGIQFRIVTERSIFA